MIRFLPLPAPCPVFHHMPWMRIAVNSMSDVRHLSYPMLQRIRSLHDVASSRSFAVTQGLFLARAHRGMSAALVLR
jgi:hypothetical protein